MADEEIKHPPEITAVLDAIEAYTKAIIDLHDYTGDGTYEAMARWRTRDDLGVKLAELWHPSARPKQIHTQLPPCICGSVASSPGHHSWCPRGQFLAAHTKIAPGAACTDCGATSDIVPVSGPHREFWWQCIDRGPCALRKADPYGTRKPPR